jgi:hypothetical protein
VLNVQVQRGRISPTKAVPIAEYVEGHRKSIPIHPPPGFVAAAEILRPSPSLLDRLQRLGVQNISRAAEMVRTVCTWLMFGSRIAE